MLITEAQKAIGAAILRAVVSENAIAVIVDRDAEAGRRLQRELPASELIVAELSHPENCDTAVLETIKKFGRIDALVNNAGVNDKVGLEHGSPEQYVSSLEKNLLHYYNMAHYCLPHLKNSKGTIVNIGSKTAVTGQRWHIRVRIFSRAPFSL